MDDLFLIGRIIFGGYFLYNSANHLLFSTAQMTEYAAAKGIPMPEVAVIVSGLLLLVGGLSILLGAWPEVGIACIGIFLVAVTPLMHNFWSDPTPAAKMADFVQFTKNVGLLGGAMAMLGVPRPWPYSVERRRNLVIG